jgi:ketosteroid isomerase-like protein
VEPGAGVSAIVDDLLGALIVRLRERDVQGAISLFDHEAVLFGSEAEESATGHAELELFFRRIFERPQTYSWQWDSLRVSATEDVVWFVGPATVVARGGDGTERSAPYRLSGVLKRQSDGRWLFALFNGAEPVEGSST